MDTPLSIQSFPRAIIHLDGDAFFASCEQSRNPSLKGKPVVVGKDRGIATAMSYEAKRQGITRGMPIREIMRICPRATILPSNYDFYSIISKRFLAIVRRYTPDVEEYSIDECFADITGMRRPLRMSYEQIVSAIQKDIEHELGVTFSAGLGPNKVVAKIASKWQKPSGTTLIPAKDIHRYLAHLDVENIWGIGPQTSAYLKKYGISTALQFARCSEQWVGARLSKPFYDIWCELNGQSLLSLDTVPKEYQTSIQRVRTFAPSSRDPQYLLSQLSKNMEYATFRARRYNLSAQRMAVFLRTSDFHHVGTEIDLPHKSSFPHEIMKYCQESFEKIFDPKYDYRATGIVLSKLCTANTEQLDLFGRHLKAARMTRLYEHLDTSNHHYGKHPVFLGSSLRARVRNNERASVQELPSRKNIAIPLFAPSIAEALF